MVPSAMLEAGDTGTPVTWGPHTTDEEYGQRPGTLGASPRAPAVQKVGSALALLPVDGSWEALFSGRALVTDDFPGDREQLLDRSATTWGKLAAS